ncbi:transcriptional regulator, HxlR family [Sphingobium chlorophenolicum L-1]|uniref:Transcriptional regulator, HxlR family n=1 Tax=Sphingobium chlorophenolicum L-1 TaxID=690566 RepID=F6EZG8_SPHCR|nr:helix-turn-helix domain-containing protein [Sphingobium chlorophenolicum]AEG49298.1 transcriptional regulator, HxlR family [Sphingobium chlorophenolicum L-1]
MENPLAKRFAPHEIAEAEAFIEANPEAPLDPRIERLVNDLIGRVADKWTLLVLELLEEQGTLRFTRIAQQVEGISQKMLTQTLRQMERDGLLTRTVHPVVPPRVDYALTPLGNSLSAAFCGVWVWAERNLEAVEDSRRRFDTRD